MKGTTGVVGGDARAETRHLGADGLLVEHDRAEAVDGARHQANRVARTNSRESPSTAGSTAPRRSSSAKHREMVSTAWSA